MYSYQKCYLKAKLNRVSILIQVVNVFLFFEPKPSRKSYGCLNPYSGGKCIPMGLSFFLLFFNIMVSILIQVVNVFLLARGMC